MVKKSDDLGSFLTRLERRKERLDKLRREIERKQFLDDKEQAGKDAKFIFDWVKEFSTSPAGKRILSHLKGEYDYVTFFQESGGFYVGIGPGGCIVWQQEFQKGVLHNFQDLTNGNGLTPDCLWRIAQSISDGTAERRIRQSLVQMIK